MLSARTFRLFVSSTFSDFIAEREALQKKVFPELERYCAVNGARFQAVDLRWGITEEAQSEHDTMRICLEEVRRCQKLSPRPNFAVLLGDRYGWEPVPARIPQDHWPSLVDAASADERKLIEESYRLDENAIPSVYCLCERDPDHAKASQHEARLLQALRSCAKRLPPREQLPYFASATHQEIVLGALSKHDDQGQMLQPDQHVHVYVRNLEGLPQDESAKDFIDWDAAMQQVVPGARERLRGLETELRCELGDHVHDLSTPWRHHGSNGAVNKAYLKRFCDAFLTHQKALIDAELALSPQTDERQQREQAHRNFGAERARVFAGRLGLLTEIARYTNPTREGETGAENPAKPTAPLILMGGGGSGKSALLARAAQLHLHGSKGLQEVIVERYIGGVPGTESLMSMLTALTADIASAYGQPEPPIPENAKALAEHFRAALGHAREQQPLTLYLDALDQLDSADSAWMLEWLPKELPQHVSLVASVRTGTRVEQSACRRYPRSLIEVPAMNPAEGQAMLEAWLADKRSAWFNAGVVPSKGRRLTPQQQESLLSAFNQPGSALWLKLAYEEASSWKSWDAPRSLPADIQGLIGDLIDQRLISQENHPKVFTERALAYITAGRFGLSEDELNRALGTDVAVRAEFEVNEKSQRKWENKKQLPSILWSRLFFDLQPYLGMAQVDGALLMRWFHREFAEAIRGRYLKRTENRATIHGTLADTFNELEQELRPNETNDDGLFKATEISSKQVSAALRRVMEQPWQLAQAGRHKELQTLLTDFGFCMGKCAARRGDDFIRDIVDPSVGTLMLMSQRAWSEFLMSVGHLLRADSNAWPAHRILLQLALESPTLGNQSFIQAWAQFNTHWPVVRALSNVTSGCEKFPMVTFDGHEGDISGVHPFPGNRLLSWGSDQDIRIWSIFSGETLGRLHHEENIVDVEVMLDGRVIFSSSDQMLNVWSLEKQERISSFRVWEPKQQGVGRFCSIDAEHFAHWSARREPWDYAIKIRSLESGNLLTTLPKSSSGGHTDFVIGVLPLDRNSLLSWSEDQTVRRWCIKSGECLAVSGDLQDPIIKVELSPNGAIQVQTRSSAFSAEPMLWVLCAQTLILLQAPQTLMSMRKPEDRTTLEWGTYRGEVRWSGARISLYPMDLSVPNDSQIGSGELASTATVQIPLKMTKLKILDDAKILVGLSDGALALFDTETGVVIDQITGRDDCAGSGCLLEDGKVALWPIEQSGKNILRVWRPGTHTRIDKQFIHQGRIHGAESIPGGLLTWGERSVVLWSLNPLQAGLDLKHPEPIRFVRRLDERGNFVSCDSNGNVALWHESELSHAKWIRTGKRGVDDVRLYGDDRILVMYKQSGRQFIEGFSVSTGTSLGVSRRVLGRRTPLRRNSEEVLLEVKVSADAVELMADGGDAAYWFNRGGSIDLLAVTPKGTVVARRGGELLLLHSGVSSVKNRVTNIEEWNRITETDLTNLKLSPPDDFLEGKAMKEAPMSRRPPKAPMSWPDVFASLRSWATKDDCAGLDTPDFKGSTWMGGGVYVVSTYSPRAEQDARAYRNRSWAHVDRFCFITRFPKAVDSLLKKLRDQVTRGLSMDKDYFYTEVTQSMAAAENHGEGLSGVLLAGIDRAEAIVSHPIANQKHP